MCMNGICLPGSVLKLLASKCVKKGIIVFCIVQPNLQRRSRCCVSCLFSGSGDRVTAAIGQQGVGRGENGLHDAWERDLIFSYTHYVCVCVRVCVYNVLCIQCVYNIILYNIRLLYIYNNIIIYDNKILYI